MRYPIGSSSSNSNRILIVEGQSDAYVVRHLALEHSDVPDFRIVNKGRLSQVLKGIALELQADDVESVGIVIDADDDLEERWSELCDNLPADFELPDDPDPDGTVLRGQPTFGVWIMPDNSSNGELEDFVQKLIPAEDAIWERAVEYIDGIPVALRPFPAKKTLRAKVYAWFSARRRPGLMGEAISEGEVDSSVELANRFIAWLREVYR